MEWEQRDTVGDALEEEDKAEKGKWKKQRGKNKPTPN
jgi:hypothetical protein